MCNIRLDPHHVGFAIERSRKREDGKCFALRELARRLKKNGPFFGKIIFKFLQLRFSKSG